MGQTEESEQMTHYSSRLAHQAMPVFVWRRMYRNTVHANTRSYSTYMNQWWIASVCVYVLYVDGMPIGPIIMPAGAIVGQGPGETLWVRYVPHALKNSTNLCLLSVG